ncbi:MAG: hypothetical protein ACOWWH_07465 [Eubacteriaceae bacterium]
MKVYKKLMNINENRELIAQIKISMRLLIALFHDDDKETVTNILFRLYKISSLFSSIISVLLYMVVSIQISNTLLKISLSSLLCCVLLIFKINKNEFICKMNELGFLFCVAELNNKSISHILFYYWKKNFLLTIILYYLTNLLCEINISENLLIIILYTLISLVFIASTYLLILKNIYKFRFSKEYILNYRNNKYKSIIINDDNENNEYFKKYKKNHLQTIIDRQFNICKINKKTNIFIVMFIITTFIIFSIANFLQLNIAFVDI